MPALNRRFVARNGIDNNSNTITNVVDPVNAQDAATKKYVNDAGIRGEAPLYTNANDIPLGSFGRIETTEGNAGASNLPTIGGLDSYSRFWNIVTYGHPNRITQVATEILAISSFKGQTFTRVKFDDTWSPWREVAFSDLLGTAAFGTLTTSGTDTTGGRVLKVGDHGIGGSVSNNNTLNCNDLGPGMRNHWGGGFTESDAITLNLPSLGGSSGTLRGWNVECYGLSSRQTQIATEIFAQGGTIRGRTFVRVKHDSTWHPWREISFSGESYNTGDILISSRELNLPDWLKCDKLTYLQSSYPNLFSELGHRPFVFTEYEIKPDPVGKPSTSGTQFCFDPSGEYLCILGNSSPYIYLWKISNGTFTLLSSPSTLPSSVNTQCKPQFSPDGTYLVIATGNTGEKFFIYKRNGDTFTKLSAPTSVPSVNCNSFSFSYDNNYFATVTDSSDKIWIYSRSGDTFTKLSTPATVPSGSDINSCEFSKDSQYLYVLATNSSSNCNLYVYEKSGSDFEYYNFYEIESGTTGIVGSLSVSHEDRYISMTYYRSSFQTGYFLKLFKRLGSTFSSISSPSISVMSANNTFFDKSKRLLYHKNTSTSEIKVFSYDPGSDTFSTYLTDASFESFNSFDVFKHFLITTRSTYFMAIYSHPYNLDTEFQVPLLEFDDGLIKGYIKT